MRKFGVRSAILYIAGALVGCTGTLAGGDDDGEFGAVTAELAMVPAGVGCVSLEVGGSIAREIRVSVVTGARTSIDTGPLPIVPLVFQARAYPSACPATGDEFAASPTWVSDAVEFIPHHSRSTPLLLVLHPYSPSRIEIDFQPILVDVAMTRDATYWVTNEGRVLVAGNAAAVGGLADVREIEGSRDFACARHGAAGQVSCWGAGTEGQLGNGQWVSASVPVLVSNLSAVVDIDVGRSHVCAIDTAARTWCWGNNRSWQISSSTTQRFATPVQVSLPLGVTPTSVHVGDTWSCATARDGAYCWGEWHAYSSPYRLATPTHVYGLSAGNIVSITGDGTPKLVSELGLFVDFDAVNRYFATTRGAPDMIAAASASYTTCAIDWHDDLYCTGNFPGGALPSAGAYVQPRRVDGAILVEVASNRVCAIDRAGDPWCWGDNDRGEIGDGTTEFRASPARARQLNAASVPRPRFDVLF